MIELQSFGKKYGAEVAVRDLSFTAFEGSLTGLVGLNGAGKTTVLKAVCSIHYADYGRILVNGLDAAVSPIENKKQTGFVPEESFLYPEYTVQEFLHYETGILFPACTQKEKTAVWQEAAKTCSIHDALNKKIKMLSKGYRQRLLLTRCLLSNPTVLVLDEPVSGLDPRQIIEMRRLIEGLAKNKTVLISSHLMQEIEALCSHIVIIHKGRMAAMGTAGEICAKTGTGSLEKAFLAITAECVSVFSKNIGGS